ncbi:MAG TPA: hypothetical protein VIM02_16970 [Rhizomicrobium sp.]|jgi:hypothetical protein
MISTLARRTLRTLCAAIALSTLASASALAAATSIWTNGVIFAAPPELKRWDLSTGALIQTVHPAHGMFGRGIAQVGNLLYYTDNQTNSVFVYNLTTNIDQGVAFSVPGAGGLGSLAYDGTNFFVEDYMLSEAIFEVTPNGTVLATIPLSQCPGNLGSCDGLEYVNGTLVSNRGDGWGPYDVYSLSGGNPQTLALIQAPNNNATTGIAFDGTYYYVEDHTTGQILVYNSAGVYQNAVMLAGAPRNIEDVSVDYATVPHDTSTLKLCKAAGLGVTVGTPFAFTVNGNPLTIPAGPAPGGYCVVAGSFAQNAPVLVQETGPLGYTVANITVAPPTSLVGMPDLLNRKVQLSMGNGATDVTFTDEKTKGETGYLEICKRGHVVGNFSFTITPGNIGPIVVPAGVCSPAIKVYGGSVTIHETPVPNTVMTGCATIPANRQGPCNPAAWSSTVTAAGGIASETTAIITDAPFFHDDGSGHIERRAPPPEPQGGNCRDYDPMQRMPQRCLCPQGSDWKDGKCAKSSSLLDNFHVGIGIGVGGGQGHGGKSKTCDPNSPVPCP